MKKSHVRLAAVLGSITLATAIAACSPGGATAGGDGAGDGAASGKIAFLMPDLASTRYEQQDSPLFTAKMEELCPDCEVIYQNADSDPAKQQQQADSAIAQGVKVIVLDAVDTKAAASIVVNAQSQSIPVITYDRPIVDTPADYYVSFDNEGIGELISTSLVEGLTAAGATGGVLIVNGSPTDDAAQLIKKGIHTGVDSSDFNVLAEFDTPGWEPQKAQDWVSGQITQFGSQIVGVVAANDGTGGGSIAAFKAAGVTPTPPVTGNDAEIAAIQRIIAGDQYNTISKPIRIVAEAAAEVAYAFLTGNPPEGETTLFDTPSQLFTPEVVTQENVKEVIFDGGIYTVDQVCTTEYASACEALGIA
ncbi:sugar ABC transporter substrate-binding protein [Agromyces sp. ISL-38]|uniref:ABC transporter substrate-binding protein n=1 Tax=Agromyces sp. ISL-38 TaxID=2819107 RepID=UPI001BEC4758|nr:sugar ABC transporter substrate-binding protein [Agromyces sp. ISL-38]MBT2497524.1 sugar ABC transporter substrate-binding protein [Agromyces sp. ISL-38]MBT2517376.1 sugar ABC transporter substrate-binding protein [Streptomyces sp. ISL-90]